MNLIDKILLEGVYSFGQSIYDRDYFQNISPDQIKRKAQKLARYFDVSSVKQTKSGSCYFILFNPKDHFTYEIRISDHTSNTKSPYYQTIELSYSQSLYEMAKTIKKKLGWV